MTDKTIKNKVMHRKSSPYEQTLEKIRPNNSNLRDHSHITSSVRGEEGSLKC